MVAQLTLYDYVPGTETPPYLTREVDPVLQPFLESGFSEPFLELVRGNLTLLPLGIVDYFNCHGGTVELSSRKLHQRLRTHYGFTFLETLKGETVRLSSEIAQLIGDWNEADWLLLKFLITHKFSLAEDVEGLRSLTEADELPFVVMEENYLVWLQLYNPRRSFLLYYAKLEQDNQQTFLQQELVKGARGITEAQVSRAIGAAIGIGLHTALKPSTKAKAATPALLQDVVELLDDCLQRLWGQRVNSSAVRDYERLFREEGSPLAAAELLTVDMLTWWLIRTTFSKFLGAAELFAEPDAELDQISTWFTECTGLPVSSITANFLPVTLGELESKISNYLYGQSNLIPGIDDMTIDYANRFAGQSANELQAVIFELIQEFLWAKYPRLIRTTMESFVALARLVQSNPLVDKLLNSEDQKWQVFCETHLPGEGGRCDFLLAPSELGLCKGGSDFWSALSNRRIILVEVKTDDKAVTNAPADAHTVQLKAYVEAIHQVNPAIQIEPYLLQVTVFGSRLLPMERPIRNYQPRDRKKQVHPRSENATVDLNAAPYDDVPF